MADNTYADEIELDFGVPWEREVDGKINMLTGEGLRRGDLNLCTNAQLEYIQEWTENREKYQREDPVRYGWTLERWRAVMSDWEKYTAHVIYGGNRSSKSSFAAKVAVYLAMTIPSAEIVCWSVDETSSVNDQQRFIYEALPQKYKRMDKKRGQMYSVQYSQKNGFTGKKLIIPSGDMKDDRGSTIIFRNYNSYMLRAQVAEGWKAHFIWLDEECPETLFQTMRKRLWDYRGRLFLTFTTLQGWTGLINNLNSKAATLEKRFAERAKPARMIPYEQLSANEEKCKIWYFWTEDNPFIPFAEAIEQVSVRPDDEIMARLYGVCVKAMGMKFPKFSRKVHVIPHEELPWIKNKSMKVTRYQTLDPAGSKKWFWLYFGLVKGIDDDMPNIYIYDEFPDISYGVWGKTSDSPKGVYGDGAKSDGWGQMRYVEHMRRMEGDDEIFERGIDKRFATNTRTGYEGDTRLLEELLLLGIRYVTPYTKRVDGHNEIELGCQAINNYLDFNEMQEIDAVNRPHMYISERCVNTIECLENFTGAGGTDEVFKDPIDCIRILMDLNPRVVDWDALPMGLSGKRGY
jgi:hypothetical protein